MTLASPFWVNLLFLVPPLLFFWFRKERLSLTYKQALYIGILGFALGIIEGSVVVYIRAAIGLLPGFMGTLQDVWQNILPSYDQTIAAKMMPQSFLVVETIREASTMVIFVTLAFLVAKKLKERVAVFMLSFAVWDISYYLHLWLTVHWPTSLTTPDVLFLIPEFWIAQAWYPILISSLTILAVLVNLKKTGGR